MKKIKKIVLGNENAPDFKIAAITSESKRIVEQFNAERRLKFPVYLDVQGSLMLKKRVSCTPTLLFLEDGIVKKIKVGITESYKDLMEDFQS